MDPDAPADRVVLAQDRELAEEAWAGDIIGIPNHGNLHIGDALTEGEELHFTGIPSFAPEYLQNVRPDDPMKAKHLGRALQQLAEEGAAAPADRFQPSGAASRAHSLGSGSGGRPWLMRRALRR